MASLPGMPGNLGLPAGTGPIQPSGSGSGSDLSLDTGGDGSTGASLIVNRTLYRAPTEHVSGTDTAVIDDGVAIIPPTTEGNTLVVVGMSGPAPNWPKFNGIIPGRNAGWPIAPDDPRPINTADNGYSGDAGPYPNGYNSGSSIGYWTNIPGGLTEVSWDRNADGSVGPWTPTLAMIYELVPCIVTDIRGSGEVDFTADPPTTVPDLQAWAVTGPAANGFYISSILYSDYPTIEGSFSSVTYPWQLDYQETLMLPVNIIIAGAIAIISNGSGVQRATFHWGGSDHVGSTNYGATSIALLPTGPIGPPSSASDLDQFLPNVWVVS